MPVSDEAASPRHVPTSTQEIFGPRVHKYALVIPVINEGDRIRQQLMRINAAHFPIDVIVADGGSKDGSLARDFVTSAGVRAVLIKTGPGKLSAQLRMAYAWCLDEGYAGIVTVDGNGKDDIRAIPAFLQKLDEGYDYVQGSRYLPGGQAINTPLDRKIAGRLIHAPAMSLAGRHWFTDTTNGFRAYSASYLGDPRVAPFRDVFMTYELLFYLTARAGQTGHRVIEIPVTRQYPKGEKTPTKISGVAGRLDMLREIYGVLSGRFNP